MFQTLISKAAIYLGVAVVAVIAGCFLGYTYDHRGFQAYKEQVALDAQVAANERQQQVAKDKEAQEKVNADAQQALQDANAHVAALVERLRVATAARVPAVAPAAGTGRADEQPLGPTAATDAGSAGGVQSCQSGALDATVDAALDAVKSVQLWRAYARETGQAQ